MPNDAPDLDTRTSSELVEQAKNLIPQFTPEWTNLNDSDPGMTLVKVHAWMTETLLYQINQLPQQNYDKFIELLGVKPKLATSAKTDIAFKLSKDLGAKDTPLVVNIPQGSLAQVDDPELQTPIMFETTHSLSAVNAAIGAVIVPNAAKGGYSLKTEYDPKSATITVTAPFLPFVNDHDGPQGSYIGLVLRPHQNLKSGKDYLQDRWPESEINLTVATVDSIPKDEVNQVQWSYYHGGIETDIFSDDQWTEVFPQGDAVGLDQSGHLSMQLPASVPLVSFSQMPRSVWQAIGVLRPPTDHDELVEDIEGIDQVLLPTDLSDDQWLSMFPAVEDESVYDELLNQIKACCSTSLLSEVLAEYEITLNATAIAAIDWLELAPDDYAMPSLATTGMIWLRVKPTTNKWTEQAIDSLHFNTVAAQAQQTFRSQRLGVSDGKPNQVFKLPRTPLLFDTLTHEPKLTLITIEQDTEQRWQWVRDFYQAGPDSRYFSFDPLTQTVQFGDGIFGAIVNAGAQVYIEQMQVGGGLAANVGRFTITKLKRAIKYVDSVTNPLAAYGGRDTESFKQTRLRAAHEIQHRDRAVTASDFAELAKQTPSVPIHTAFALANTAVGSRRAKDRLVPNRPGAVTVVILPRNDEARPFPSFEDIKAVCEYLDPRRLITTELFVVGPEYKTVTSLLLNVSIGAGFDLAVITQAVQQRLVDFFHPVIGGREGEGWPFGEDIYLADVYCQILAIEGVSRAYDLEIVLDAAVAVSDRIELEDQQLVSLAANVMNIKVAYEY